MQSQRPLRQQAIQTTPKGLKIPVPIREEFDQFVKKVAPPTGRKRLADSDQPHEQSD